MGLRAVRLAGGELEYGGVGVWAADTASLETYGIAVASLEGDPGVRPGFHCFVAFKAPWFEITDGLPQYEGYPVEKVG